MTPDSTRTAAVDPAYHLQALKACNEAMPYMSEYGIPVALPEQVEAVIAKAEGGAA